MKKTGAFIILVAVLFGVFTSCEDERDATKVVMLFKTGSSETFTEANSKLLYEVETYSIVSALKEFTISSFDSEYGNKVLLDSVPGVKKFSLFFEYNVPDFSKDSVKVTLRFKSIDSNDNYQELNRTVIVTGGLQIIQPLTGIVMNSATSGKPNAFSLSAPSDVFLKSLSEPDKIDVYDYELPENPSVLSKEWRTNTDVQFGRINNFNYAAATSTMIKNTYASLIKQKAISDIQPNDIIFIGREDVACGVVQITDVVDNEGSQDDYYRFNVKMIK